MNAKAERLSSSKGAPSDTKPPFSFSSLLPSVTIPLSSPIWALIEKFYAIPPPSNPPPKRTKPMRVLCVGLPRSGTESLQQALLILGYDYTYHGWDIVYPPPSASDSDPDSEQHTDAQLWTSLARAKFHPSVSESESESSKSGLSASDFDQILSRSQAVTDAPGSLFAPELISCFPEAKVILNQRRDTQKWKTSILNTLVKANESWAFYLASWFGPRECFWAWHVYERFLWPRLFGVGPGETLRDAVEKRAEIVSRDHCNMIRGMLKNNPERLLEWYIEDGWGPLCKFLGRPIPDVPFPHVNAAKGGWKAREEQCNKRWVEKAFLRLIGTGLLLALIAFWLAVRG